ncbi:MXAN_5187 C-terminal domain-containing protein [Vulgatibacter incomptus]|uniref:Uncharacterized protein n=1 Tax=Vulgatibacter incomptus TaxID=1391653 RepID=A0A0K1PH71_9BACT|nr:MXAN_5187 C-terminal domain-containing protein [Vulgatibacter incomptus]AKU92870.1 hypothetical protein AKJ08_3257 [Vulgatibacter incomptus]
MSKNTGGGGDEALRRVAELEAATEALKVRYEQFFQGTARMPPAEDHAQLRSALLKLKASAPRGAAVRFRLDALYNRFLSYERMWSRVVREREEGTYAPDLARARLRRSREAGAGVSATARAASAAGAGVAAEAGGVSDSRVAASSPDPREAATTQAPAVRKESPAGPRVPPASGSISDARLRAIYDSYVLAKRRCGESADGVSFERLAAKLRGQVPGLLEKHKTSNIDFKVVIHDGKAMLKVVPG